MRSNPVIGVLSTQPLLFGGEVRLVVANVAIAFVATWMLGIIFWPAVALVVHIVLMQMAKRDPMTRTIYLKYQNQSDRYEPWVDGSTLGADRPIRVTNREHL